MTRATALRAHFALSPGNARRAAVASSLAGALGPSLAKSTRLDGGPLAFWRFVVVAPLLAVVVLARAARRRRLDPGAARATAGGWAALGGGVSLAATLVLFFSAIERTSIANASLLSSLTPVVTSLAGWLLFGERPSVRFWGSAALALAGVAVVVAGTSSHEGAGLTGDLLALGSTATFAAYMLFAKSAREGGGRGVADTFLYLLVVNVVAAACVGALAAFESGLPPLPPARALGFVVLLALVAGIFSHVLLVWAQPSISAALTSVLQLVTPVAASAYAWLLQGERLTWWHAAGGAVTLVGLWGAVRTAPAPVVEELATEGGLPA